MPYSDCSHWCDKKKLTRKRTHFGSQFKFIVVGRAWQNRGGRRVLEASIPYILMDQEVRTEEHWYSTSFLLVPFIFSLRS